MDAEKMIVPEKPKAVPAPPPKRPPSLAEASVLRTVGGFSFSVSLVAVTSADRIVRDLARPCGVERVGPNEVVAGEEDFLRIGSSWPASIRIVE